MILKFQTPVPGQQPNVAAGTLATMRAPVGPRIGVWYAELTVIKAAGGAGVYSLPLLSDILDNTKSVTVKIDGREQRNRLGSELITLNLLQDSTMGGSVEYFQGGGLVASALAANNTAVPAALAANTATTAVFQVPIYFAQMYRKDLATGEGLSLPTAFQGGGFLPALTFEFPIANNAGAVFSGHNCKFWFDFDGLQWPQGVNSAGQRVNASAFVKEGRKTLDYAAVGDKAVPITVPGGDQLMQFSLLLAAGDTWSKAIIKKNGTVLKEITPGKMRQMLLDHGMNVAAILPNRCDVVFDLNDDLNANLPLNGNDTFEVTLTLATVAGAANMVILTETFGLPN